MRMLGYAAVGLILAVAAFVVVRWWSVRRESSALTPGERVLVHRVTWETSASGRMVWVCCHSCGWRAGEPATDEDRLGTALVAHLQRGSR